MITDEDIADSIWKACKLSERRYHEAVKAGSDGSDASLAEFISGISQSAWFLSANDGEITSQQLERAIIIVGNKLGLIHSRP